MASMLHLFSGKHGFSLHIEGVPPATNIRDCDIVHEFTQMKLSNKYRYIMMKVENSTIVMSEVGPPSATYEDMLQHLPTLECRFVVYNAETEKQGVNKLVFILWAPDEAKIRDKMKTASSKDYVKKRLIGISVEIGGTDISELDKDSVMERINRL